MHYLLYFVKKKVSPKTEVRSPGITQMSCKYLWCNFHNYKQLRLCVVCPIEYLHSLRTFVLEVCFLKLENYVLLLFNPPLPKKKSMLIDDWLIDSLYSSMHLYLRSYVNFLHICGVMFYINTTVQYSQYYINNWSISSLFKLSFHDIWNFDIIGT